MAAWPVTGTLLLFREMPVVFQPPYRAAVIGRTGRGDYGHGLDVAMLGQPNLTVVAVADDDPKGLAAAAKRLGVDRAYDDYREMLDREKPQFVAVAPRWVDCHKAMILDCAERGIHVFCEKPLAPTWPRPTRSSRPASGRTSSSPSPSSRGTARATSGSGS